DLSGTPPIDAVKEFSFGGSAYMNCTGLAMDATSFFTTCRKGNTGSVYALLRIARSDATITEVTTALPVNTSAMALHAVDKDGDGNADLLYVQDSKEEGHFLCGPYTGAPYTYRHFSFGT